jgi:biopolymer transport protein ExbD
MIRRKRRKHHAAVEASSLSDILFFLMLFFLMISTMANPSAIKLLLPHAKNSKSIPNEIINVSLDANLNYFVNDKKVNYEQLNDVITKEQTGMTKPTIVLRVDKTISVNDLVHVIDVVNKLKIPLVIATDRK